MDYTIKIILTIVFALVAVIAFVLDRKKKTYSFLAPVWYTLGFFVINFIENEKISTILIIILVILIIPMGIIMAKTHDKVSKD